MFELIIRNGTIVDGTGKERFPADLGVRNRKISTVDDLSGAAAARELDATGMIVCPGFIDIHSHSDFTLLVDPRAVSSITQGVTTGSVRQLRTWLRPHPQPGPGADEHFWLQR